MTGWLFTAAVFVLTAGWTVVAMRWDARQRLERLAVEEHQRIRARVARTVRRPYADEFGLVHCPGCGGFLEHVPGRRADRCSCPTVARAA